MMNEHAVITFTLYPILSRRTYRSEKKKKKKTPTSLLSLWKKSPWNSDFDKIVPAKAHLKKKKKKKRRL